MKNKKIAVFINSSCRSQWSITVSQEEKQKEEGTKQIAVLNPQLYVELVGKIMIKLTADISQPTMQTVKKLLLHCVLFQKLCI